MNNKKQPKGGREKWRREGEGRKGGREEGREGGREGEKGERRENESINLNQNYFSLTKPTERKLLFYSYSYQKRQNGVSMLTKLFLSSQLS
jgi:hypothetical protein